jgi:hypothetical protein
MLKRCAALFATLFAALPARAEVPCGSMERTQAIAAARGGEPFAKVTPEQWQFLRGLYAMDPDTPPGLPPGDSAAMSKHPDGSITVVFIDGDLACAPMKLEKNGVDMLMAVGRGDVIHAGHGL